MDEREIKQKVTFKKEFENTNDKKISFSKILEKRKPTKNKSNKPPKKSLETLHKVINKVNEVVDDLNISKSLLAKKAQEINHKNKKIQNLQNELIKNQKDLNFYKNIVEQGKNEFDSKGKEENQKPVGTNPEVFIVNEILKSSSDWALGMQNAEVHNDPNILMKAQELLVFHKNLTMLLKNELDGKVKEICKLIKTLTRYQKENVRLSTEVIKLNKSVSDSTKDLIEIKLDYAKQEKDLSRISNENDKLLIKNIEMKHKISNLTISLANANRQIENQREEIVKLQDLRIKEMENNKDQGKEIVLIKKFKNDIPICLLKSDLEEVTCEGEDMKVEFLQPMYFEGNKKNQRVENNQFTNLTLNQNSINKRDNQFCYYYIVDEPSTEANYNNLSFLGEEDRMVDCNYLKLEQDKENPLSDETKEYQDDQNSKLVMNEVKGNNKKFLTKNDAIHIIHSCNFNLQKVKKTLMEENEAACKILQNARLTTGMLGTKEKHEIENIINQFKHNKQHNMVTSNVMSKIRKDIETISNCSNLIEVEDELKRLERNLEEMEVINNNAQKRLYSEIQLFEKVKSEQKYREKCTI